MFSPGERVIIKRPVSARSYFPDFEGKTGTVTEMIKHTKLYAVKLDGAVTEGDVDFLFFESELDLANDRIE